MKGRQDRTQCHILKPTCTRKRKDLRPPTKRGSKAVPQTGNKTKRKKARGGGDPRSLMGFLALDRRLGRQEILSAEAVKKIPMTGLILVAKNTSSIAYTKADYLLPRTILS
jgi:hypothetical protein